jgi:hypothetical protein
MPLRLDMKEEGKEGVMDDYVHLQYVAILQ